VYRPGERSRDWRKLKRIQRQELVVGGWTEPRGSRSRFGALLLGIPEEDGAGEKTRLRYVGHTGGGFTERDLTRIAGLLAARATATCPFPSRPVTNEPPHWVRPELVAEVKFSEWTDDGLLRQPTFLGLRDDVIPSHVRRERKQPAAAGGPP